MVHWLLKLFCRGQPTVPQPSPGPVLPDADEPYAGWPFKIQPSDLASPARVQRLWEHALSRSWVDAGDRLKFFAEALWCVRAWREQRVRYPGAVFSSRIRRQGHWLFTADDEQVAGEQLVEIQRMGATISGPLARLTALHQGHAARELGHRCVTLLTVIVVMQRNEDGVKLREEWLAQRMACSEAVVRHCIARCFNAGWLLVVRRDRLPSQFSAVVPSHVAASDGAIA